MDDPELEAIRRARMAELQGGRGGGGGGGPSSGGYAAGGMGMGRAGGEMGEDSGKQQEQMAAQEEMKRQALSTILDPEARERCEYISLSYARYVLSWDHSIVYSSTDCNGQAKQGQVNTRLAHSNGAIWSSEAEDYRATAHWTAGPSRRARAGGQWRDRWCRQDYSEFSLPYFAYLEPLSATASCSIPGRRRSVTMKMILTCRRCIALQ